MIKNYIAYGSAGNKLFSNITELATYFKLDHDGVKTAIETGCAVFKYGEKRPYYLDVLRSEK